MTKAKRRASGTRQPETRTRELGAPVVVAARYPQELLARIDAARADEPRQRWLVEALDLNPASAEAIVHDRVKVEWDAALREELKDLDPDPLFWLDAYCAAHAAKHGAPLKVGGPVFVPPAR